VDTAKHCIGYKLSNLVSVETAVQHRLCALTPTDLQPQGAAKLYAVSLTPLVQGLPA
jgi:hypothetical protein